MDMRMIQKIVAGCIGLCLFACTETDELKTTAGKTGFVVSLIDGSVGVESRKTPAELNVPKTEFTIKVWKAGSNELVASAPCTGETGQVIEVGTGVYDVTAEAGENPLIALDAPYYKGITEDQRVDADKTTNVSIACKVANSLVSVKYDEENLKFSDIYQDGYYVRVVAGGDSEDIKNVENSVYFRAGSAFEVYFCGMKIGETEEKQVKLDVGRTTLQAGDHLILTLSPEPDKYELPLSITKVEVKQETINATIPMEWLPKPKIAGFNNDGATIVTQVETADAVPAVLNFTGSMNIQDVELTLDLKDVDYVSLNRTYTLSVLSEEDRTALTNAGLVLPILNEAKEGNIDFTTLVGKLKIASGSETTHNIKLRVKANDRWSSEENSPAVYEIKTIAPKISITVKPEDIWSKSLTVSGVIVESGNEAMINSNLKYQFNDNGTWKNCNENNLAMLTEHPSDCKMQVRAVYRGVVECEPTTFALEVPEQLPNGNMDGWSYEIYGDRYSFNPWTDGGTPFWDTSNDFTTRHRNNVLSSFIDNYNGFHSVSYVAGKNAIGLAAELRSTANGRGNTRASIGNWVVGHTEQDYNKVAGELFTGKTNVTTGINDVDAGGDTYEKEKNASFSSRPTALQFYYKYVPYSSDSWSVHIELLDENKNIIIQNEKTSSETMSDWSAEPFRVELNYANDMTYAKCKYIYVIFKSTINEGANMPYQEITQTFYVLENGILNAKTYSPAYVGSVLTIDDISLVYDK